MKDGNSKREFSDNSQTNFNYEMIPFAAHLAAAVTIDELAEVLTSASVQLEGVNSAGFWQMKHGAQRVPGKLTGLSASAEKWLMKHYAEIPEETLLNGSPLFSMREITNGRPKTKVNMDFALFPLSAPVDGGAMALLIAGFRPDAGLPEYTHHWLQQLALVGAGALARLKESTPLQAGKYQLLFQTSSDAVIFFDAETLQVEDVNDAALAMYGYTRKKFLKLTIFDLSAEKEKTRRAVKDLILAPSPSRKIPERLFVRKDGTLFPGEITTARFQDRGRLKLVGVVRDITRRVEAQHELEKLRMVLEKKVTERTAELEEINQQLRKEIKERQAIEKNLRIKEFAISSSINAIAFADLDGKLTYVNQAFLNLWGYHSADEVIGMRAVDCWKDKKAARKVFQTLRENGRFTGELEALKKDGTTCEMQLSASMVTDTEGAPVVMMASCIELTEQKRAQRSLRESEERYRYLIENQGEGIGILDPKENFIYCNKVGEEIFGVEPGSLVGRNLKEFVTPESFKQILRQTKNRKQGKRSTYTLEILRGDGHKRHLLVTVTPGFDSAGQFAWALGVFRDDTERRLDQEKLNQKVAIEQALSRVSSRFVSARNIDQAINASLQEIGRLSQASRTYLFLYSDDGKRMSNTHEWCRKGVKPQIQNLQDISVDEFPWWQKKMRSGEVINIPDVHKMPTGAESEKKMLLAQEIKSLLVLPLYLGDKLGGFFGLDDVGKFDAWSEDDISMIQLFAVILGNALERNRTEEVLRESEERYRTMMDNAHDMIWSVDERGNITFLNKRVEEITGYLYRDVIGKSISPLIVKEDFQKMREIFYNTLKGESSSTEVRVFAADKTELLLSVNTSPIYEKGKIVGAVSFGRDITGQHLAEEALRESETKFRSIVEESIDGIVLTDEEGIVIEWNQGQTAISGVERENAVGRPFWEVQYQIRPVEQKSAKKYEQLFQRVNKFLKTQQAPWLNQVIEQEIETPAGERRIVQSVTFIVNAGSRRLIGSISRNVTGQKQVEQALRRSDQHNKAMLQAMPDMMFVLSREGKLVDYNAGSRLAGQDLVGRNLTDLDMKAEEIQRALEVISQVLESGEVQTLEYQIGEQMGGKTYEARIAKLDEDSVMAVMRDITERKKLEEELLRSEKLESLGVLAGGIAHDFNNLMTAVLGNISLAKMQLKPDHPATERLTAAENASIRTKDLTRQLLTFSKGGVPIKKVSDIGPVVREAAGFALAGSQARLRFEQPEDLWLVDADEGQITQVIQNLIINADQAMPQGGEIQLTCENMTIGEEDDSSIRPGKYVKITVRDRGTGIPKKYLQRIFDPYFTTKQRGSGLGLATAYSIIHKHDGYITVHSKLGAGSTFYIYLPASGEMRVVPAKKAAGKLTHGGRVLVMDDEEVVRETACNMLAKLGFDVECAEDGMEAVEKYRLGLSSGQPFSVVILDLTIPGAMGGREAIKELLKLDPDVRAIVSSGYSNDPVLGSYREYGFCGMIEKPYRSEELELVMQIVMRSQKNGNRKS